MACNCFETVNEKLQEKLEDPTGSLNCVHQIIDNKFVTKPAVTFVYNKKKQDGSRQQKRTEIEVTYSFCPFCGKKYDEETNEQEEQQ